MATGSAMRSLVLAYSVRSRARKGRVIARHVRESGIKTVVLVGVGGDATSLAPNERIVESAVEAAATVVAACDLRPTVTGWPYVIGDALALPFRTDAADLVLSNAVIEHVGDRHAQERFLAEHLRVARYAVVTTPNRWFPIESHTNVIFKHWSPAWRRGRSEFTRLLSKREFEALLPPNATVTGAYLSAAFIAFIPCDPET